MLGGLNEGLSRCIPLCRKSSLLAIVINNSVCVCAKKKEIFLKSEGSCGFPHSRKMGTVFMSLDYIRLNHMTLSFL